jgi:hypothetical protein
MNELLTSDILGTVDHVEGKSYVRKYVANFIKLGCSISAGERLNKVSNTPAGLEFIKELRKMVRGSGHRIEVYGRNPNRKSLGIRREIGRVKKELASYFTLFLVPVRKDWRKVS